MSEEIEIQMMKNTTFELPMQTLRSGSSPKSPPLPSFTLSLREVTIRGGWRFADGREQIEKSFNENEELDYLEIKLTIGGDDPRIKAFDVYTQYSGVRTVLIKHAPPTIWPCGINFYKVFSDWDDTQDRILKVGEVRPTTISTPTEYSSATGLRAKSWPLEGSENGKITVGLCRGRGDSGENNYYGKSNDVPTLSLDLGHTLEYDPDNMGSGCVLESHNPICSYTYIWEDSHPIPFASYNVWGYINDASYGNMSPFGLAFACYQPQWLKAGRIVGRSGSGPYDYSIRCIRIEGNKISSDLVSVSGVLLRYEVGRWLLLSRKGSETWHIIPTSQSYWENAVDWLRKVSGF